MVISIKNMLKGVVAVVTASQFLCACSSDEPGGREGETDVVPVMEMSRAEQEIASSQSDFQLTMFAEVVKSLKDDNTNIVFSPLSATMSMSILANSTTPDCADQILDVMGQSSLKALNDFNGRLMDFLPRSDRYTTFLLANNVWYPSGQKLDNQFEKILSSVFRSSPSAVDFGNPQTISIINKWVRDNTMSKIDKIADLLNCNERTNLFLANAMYYKGQWRKPFDKSKTKVYSFNGVEEVKDIQFMTDRRNVDYARSSKTDAEMIKLDFRGNGMSLFIILPSATTDVSIYFEQFDKAEFCDMFSEMETYDLNLRIPKFTIRGEMDLSNYLTASGLTTESYPLVGAGLNAEYNGVLGQTSYFSIDEEGVTLASATGTMTSSTLVKTKDFYVDRPFVYLLREECTGSILLAGMIRQL